MSVASRPMVPEDLARIRFVSDPQISPDGRRVAFVVTTLSLEQDEYRSSIWMVDVDGGAPRPFTAGPGRDTAPRFSPDGRRLAFLSEREGRARAQLYVISTDGGEAVRLTDVGEGVKAPVWSPDGARLAFVARVPAAPEAEPPTGRPASRLPRVIDVLKYRANEVGFVHDRPRHVFVVPADGSAAPRAVTTGEFDDRDPAWLPDGRALVFASARHAERDFDSAADLWVVPAEGGEPRRLTATTGPALAPAVSPDGRTVAYLGHGHPRDVSRHVQVYTVALEDGVPACLSAALDRHCEPLTPDLAPLWAGNDTVLFLADDAGSVPLYRVRTADGAVPERLVGGARQLTGCSVSGDGRWVAFTATDPLAPAEVFVCRADGREERRLTDLNGAWRETVALSAPEGFAFERAGFAVEGWVMRPAGFEAGRRYPVLLNIHGGPAAQYGHRFFDEFQVYAGAGYAVVYLNPRGSRGYGEAFARAVVGDWGGGDCADVLGGLDEALRRFAWLDPGRLGVLGGSYGGYLTSWIVGHTDRFRAACSERAVNALWSMVGTSDIGHAFQIAHAGHVGPWDDPGFYVERSPLTHARSIRTPLLILHTEDDLRCPIEQAEQLFVALRHLRRPVRFVRFPEGNHELSRSGRPRLRVERFRIILDWFGRYLPPGGAPGPVPPA